MTHARHAAASDAKSAKSATAAGWLPTHPRDEDKIMSDYDAKMCDLIRKAAPLTLAKAKELAELDAFTKAGKSHRSIISKAQSMGLEYIKLTPTRKPRENTPTKAAYLGSIRKALALPEREGDLTKAELAAILANIA